MSANIEQAIVEKLRALSSEQQQEVLAFAEELARKNAPRKTIWEKIDERIKEVPPEVWDELPTDGAEQHDHYLYGTPKK